jgi:putative methionine-R-sulfoxide reductase with GAF domain
MSSTERIRQYLFASGLDRLGDHTAVIEKSIHDLIGQLNTPMEVSIDSLYRYPVPKLSEDGACSLIDDLDPTPYDLARVLGGETDANTRKLKLLNIVVTRLSLMTGADWVGIYQRRAVRGGESLVKLAYRGRASRAEFPLTEAFAQGSTNSRVGLDGMALVIGDVAKHVTTGAGFYVCDNAVQSEMCLPIFDEAGRTIGIIDAEAEPLAFFNEERQCALVAAAMVVPALLP